MSTRSKLRKAIDIQGKSVDIKWIKNLKSEDGEACFGTYSYAGQTIEMALGQPVDLAESTMLHEVLEALLRELRIRSLKHEDLDRLESGLYAVLTGAGVDLSPLVKEKA